VKLTHAGWYAVALVIAAVSCVAAMVIAASAYTPIREAMVTPTVDRADARGKTLAVYTNDENHADVECYARDRKKRRIDIPAKSVDAVTYVQGASWYLLALLPEGRNNLKITCRPTTDRPDTANYAFATIDGFTSAASNGRTVAMVGSGAGAALAGVVWYRRSRRSDA
jgi:hypothetical protein